MSQTRSPIVNSLGLSLKTEPTLFSSLRAGTEEVCPARGPWLIRQFFEKKEATWLAGLLGGYFPSLPRALSLLAEAQRTTVTLGAAPGEPLQDYCKRVGPMPVATACIMVWRLATELEALETWLPEALSYVDPLSCKVGLWQQEFLQLFIDRFEQPYLTKKPGDLPSRLLKVCSMLLSGQANPVMDHSVAARVPSSLLTALRQLQHTGNAALDLKQLKGMLLMATAAVTRELRGSNLMSQLIVGEVWHPKAASRALPQMPNERREGRRSHLSPVRLSRFLAHRNRLNASEITILLRRLEELTGNCQEVNLDPQHIWLHLPGQRESILDAKILDVRLDSLPEFSVSLDTFHNNPAQARSPVTFREASAPGLAFTDLQPLRGEQFSRLVQTLQDGTFSLSGYDMGGSQDKELPGLFSCYLPPAPPDPRALASLKSAIGDSFSLPRPVAAVPAAGMPVFPVHPLSVQPPRLPDSMKMILITAGSGGTGKSTIARLIYELANFENRDDVAMFDCDALGNRDFQKISPEKIESMPIDNVDTMRRLVETAMERKLVLADLPASCQDVLARDLNPEIIQSLRVDEGLHWMPIHLLTAKAAAVPAIKQWRSSVFGDSPSVLIVSMKDGPVSADMLDEVARPQDIVLKMPLLDQSLASALDASSSSWIDILDGKAGETHRMFSNPLVKRQLRFKRKECEDALFPLLRLILNDQQKAE